MVTDEVLPAHLAGRQPYSVYLLTGDRTGALAVDFDEDNLYLPTSFVACARRHGLSGYIERSKSKGYHVWIFFERQGVLAYKARLVARKILADMGAPATEVFPKQDALTDGVSWGNFVNTPLAGALVPKGRTVFVDPAEPTRVYPDQWELLERVQRHTEKDLDTVIKRCHLEAWERPRVGNCSKAEPGASAFWLPPCARRILAEGVSAYQRVSCFRLAVHLKRNGIPYDRALAVLRAWARKNRPVDGRRIITEREIEYQTRCAFDRPYRSFGCEDAAMVAYCQEECPLYPYTVGRSLIRDGPCVYVHVLKWGDETITLPPLPKKIIKSQSLTGGRASVVQTDSGITLTVPQPDSQNIDMIVKLTLDGPAGEIPPLGVARSGIIRPNMRATASNVYQHDVASE
jgi:hypothetical protein